ncbi:4-alpha-glucanotransferase [Nymphaea thermarum]|nr:4-alpha-glucanotransferase [Nymphaea thermarum]
MTVSYSHFLQGRLEDAPLPHRSTICFYRLLAGGGNLGENEKSKVRKYLHLTEESHISWALMEAAASSVARTVIIPMQDVLELDNSARMNTPATQHQRQWIPAPDDSKQPCPIKLQFTMLGRKLNVNTRPVDSGRKPVTRVRLFLEGDVVEEKLTIHIQHLSSLPAFLILSNELAYGSGIVNDKCQTLFTCMYCTC